MQSESIKELAAALAKAQAKIGGAKKTATNPHFNSKYANLDAVWDAWQEVGPEQGIALTQATRITETGAVVLVSQLTHSSGEWLKGEYPVNPTRADPQGLMSALTYARRGALSALVGIAPEDDDGNAASEKAEPKGMDDREEAAAGDLIDTADDLEALRKAWVSAVKAAGQDQRAIARLEGRKNARKAALSGKAA